ncbi:hypothetical protein [Frigoribacterium sp. PhB116]|uniref:GAP1-N1 domain-containing protein n=1 Tax=Frigoribacterium sp. PhB116 TaxID=2485174 RepID=UPI0010F1EE26|nr:hypothetical protein [Frigoribacterium sp. PhB116]TDT61718.1 hypothetical protein EDF20_3013 [Frigoribacterium sp. PhB116]
MTRRQLDQALFGYDRGHRLLSASTTIDEESSRILRVVTDMSFEGRSESFLSVLPLPAAKAHAFIRSWPAGLWMRPGAVWSRVAILAWQDLDEMTNFSDVIAAISPVDISDARTLDELAFDYMRPLVIETHGGVSDPVHVKNSSLDVGALLSGLYSSSRPIILPCPDPRREEMVLLNLFSQQWPRLRRSFAFRTRYRSSDSAVTFDVEIVEKKDRVSSLPPVREWATSLAEGLDGARPSLNVFLQRYGADSRRGRRDMSVLVRMHDALIGAQDGRGATAILFAEFPSKQDMGRLKHDIFSEQGLLPLAESERVALAVENSQGLSLGELQIGRRLVRLVLRGGTIAAAEHASDFAEIPDEQIDALLMDIADHLDGDSILVFAEIHEDLALLVAARRPEFLESADLWEALESEAVGEVFGSISAEAQQRILRQLLVAGAIRPLVLACNAHLGAWWQLVAIASQEPTTVAGVADQAATLRVVLERVGMAGLSGHPARMVTGYYAVTVLLSAPLQAGLWRRVKTRDWLSALAAAQNGDLGNVPGYVLDRLMAVCLVSGAQGSDAALRKKSWELAFPRLHDALRNSRFDGESWSVLSAALPSGPEWDRCYRLRRGAVAEIRRDDWGANSSSRLIASAGRDARDMLDQLDRRRKARKGWVEDVLRLIGMK